MSGDVLGNAFAGLKIRKNVLNVRKRTLKIIIVKLKLSFNKQKMSLHALKISDFLKKIKAANPTIALITDAGTSAELLKKYDMTRTVVVSALLVSLLYCYGCNQHKPEFQDIQSIIEDFEKGVGRELRGQIIDFCKYNDGLNVPSRTEGEYQTFGDHYGGVSSIDNRGIPISGAFQETPDSIRVKYSYDGVDNHYYKVRILKDRDGNYYVLAALFPRASVSQDDEQQPDDQHTH